MSGLHKFPPGRYQPVFHPTSPENTGQLSYYRLPRKPNKQHKQYQRAYRRTQRIDLTPKKQAGLRQEPKSIPQLEDHNVGNQRHPDNCQREPVPRTSPAVGLLRALPHSLKISAKFNGWPPFQFAGPSRKPGEKPRCALSPYTPTYPYLRHNLPLVLTFNPTFSGKQLNCPEMLFPEKISFMRTCARLPVMAPDGSGAGHARFIVAVH